MDFSCLNYRFLDAMTKRSVFMCILTTAEKNRPAIKPYMEIVHPSLPPVFHVFTTKEELYPDRGMEYFYELETNIAMVKFGYLPQDVVSQRLPRYMNGIRRSSLLPMEFEKMVSEWFGGRYKASF